MKLGNLRRKLKTRPRAEGRMSGITDLGKERDQFIIDLIQNKVRGSSLDVATRTVKFLRRFIAHSKTTSLKELLVSVKKEGTLLYESCPTEFIVWNMTAKVLRLIREEYARLMTGSEDIAGSHSYDALHMFWEESEQGGSVVHGKDLRSACIESIGELLLELEVTRENIASQAINHIQHGDTVMTLGDSLAVEAFLTEAARKRKFSIIIIENGPDENGKKMGHRLEKNFKREGRNVTVNTMGDAWCFAKMSSVTKVILGAYSVMADGGFISPSGVNSLCLSAKYYSVPVIVCSPFYKLTPKYLSTEDHECLSQLSSPRDLIPFSDGDIVGKVDVFSPSLDFVPPELVSLYITHTSGNAPSYIYRMISEQYHPDDWQDDHHSLARES